MKVIGEFNRISDKLKKEIPKLKRGQVVTFQMLNGVANPDSEEKQRTPVIYPKTQIRTLDRIYDPYLNNDEGGYVDIGVPSTYSKDSFGNLEVQPKLLVPGLGLFQFSGKFSLMGGKVDDEEMFEFLWLSNENESNPHRDTSVKPLFKMQNLLEESKTTIKTTNDLRDALNLAADMDEQTKREVAASLNWATIAESEILTAKINDFATKFPTEFLKAYNSPKRKTKSVIKKAMDAGVINFDVISKEISLGSEVVATLTLKNGEDILTAFTDWINTAKNGQEVFENIQGQLEQKVSAPKAKKKAVVAE